MLPIFDIHLRRQAENEASRQLRIHRRNLRFNSEPFAFPDRRFIELFRLDKNVSHNLITILRPHLNAPIRTSGISIETKVFTALRFYATECYQRSVGEDYHLGLSQSTTHRCIHEVTTVIEEQLAEIHINFPNRVVINRNKQQFMANYNFPGIIGAIDCTHVAILKPVNEEHDFINRKGYHSLNVQVICDSNLKILNVKANIGGATHDSFIWRQSVITNYLNNLYNDGHRGFWLIGDSGYPLEPWLMTPFLNAEDGTPEAAFNHQHCSARNCVERCIGLLKARFRCVLKERIARYFPQFVGTLFNTCTVLHNICVENGVPGVGDPIYEYIANINIINAGEHQQHNFLNIGQQVRRNIINRYFVQH